MFGQTVKADATVLDGGRRRGTEQTQATGGWLWVYYDYEVEVRPADGEPFRTTAIGKVAMMHRPGPGDVIQVKYHPRSHKAKFNTVGDPRFDDRLIFEREQRESGEA